MYIEEFNIWRPWWPHLGLAATWPTANSARSFGQIATYRPNGLLDYFDQMGFLVDQVMPIHKR